MRWDGFFFWNTLVDIDSSCRRWWCFCWKILFQSPSKVNVLSWSWSYKKWKLHFWRLSQKINQKKSMWLFIEFTVKSLNLSACHGGISAFHREFTKQRWFLTFFFCVFLEILQVKYCENTILWLQLSLQLSANENFASLYTGLQWKIS